MLEKYDKVIMASIIAAVAIILITSVLIPVIDDASQGTEIETEAEGAYGTLMYQGTPESPTGMAIQYIQLRPSETDNTMINVYKGSNLSNPITTIDIDALDGKKLIVYSDVNATLSIQNDKYVFTGNTTLPADSDITNTVSVSYHRQYGMVYDNGIDNNVRISGQTTYYYAYSNSGDYANFEGNNPPVMDTPAASISGVYIGEKYTTEIVVPPYAAVLNVIPILMIVGVIVTVIGVVLYQKRDV